MCVCSMCVNYKTNNNKNKLLACSTCAEFNCKTKNSGLGLFNFFHFFLLAFFCKIFVPLAVASSACSGRRRCSCSCSRCRGCRCCTTGRCRRCSSARRPTVFTFAFNCRFGGRLFSSPLPTF